MLLQKDNDSMVKIKGDFLGSVTIDENQMILIKQQPTPPNGGYCHSGGMFSPTREYDRTKIFMVDQYFQVHGYATPKCEDYLPQHITIFKSKSCGTVNMGLASTRMKFTRKYKSKIKLFVDRTNESCLIGDYLIVQMQGYIYKIPQSVTTLFRHHTYVTVMFMFDLCKDVGMIIGVLWLNLISTDYSLYKE